LVTKKDSGHRVNGDRVVPLHAAQSLQKIDKLIDGGVRFIRAAEIIGRDVVDKRSARAAGTPAT